jgi:hypothetical protein
MQTFLPRASFRLSARCIDNKRLGKQRVECKQILLALGTRIGQNDPYTSRWRNHPAVKMWAGYETALTVYAIVVCREWIARGFNDSLLPEFMQAYTELRATIAANRYPLWFGRRSFHASHRSNLLRKDYTHYSKFGWTEPIDLPYVWPTQLTAPISAGT